MNSDASPMLLHTTVCILLLLSGCDNQLPIQYITGMQVSPSRKRIAFVSTHYDPQAQSLKEQARSLQELGRAQEAINDTLYTRLWVVSIVDGGATGRDVEVDGYSAWSPDEAVIAFARYQIGIITEIIHPGGVLELKTLTLSTGKVTHVAGPGCSSPQFSPDGEYLGYVRNGTLTARKLSSGENIIVAPGVNPNWWCWNDDGSKAYCIRNRAIIEYRLRDAETRVFNTGGRRDPSQLLMSPDGRMLGFYHSGSFCTVDLASGCITKCFECDNIAFDWTDAGICYLDEVKGKDTKTAQLMFYSPEKQCSVAIATGEFREAQWLFDSRIVVRKGTTELWIYDIRGKQPERLFPTTRDK